MSHGGEVRPVEQDSVHENQHLPSALARHTVGDPTRDGGDKGDLGLGEIGTSLRKVAVCKAMEGACASAMVCLLTTSNDSEEKITDKKIIDDRDYMQVPDAARRVDGVNANAYAPPRNNEELKDDHLVKAALRTDDVNPSAYAPLNSDEVAFERCTAHKDSRCWFCHFVCLKNRKE